MKKNEFEGLEKSIQMGDSEATLKLKKIIFKSSIIYLTVELVLLILALILWDTASLLSIISPNVFQVFSIIFLAFLSVTALIYTFKNEISGKIVLLYYKVFDMVSFILMLLTTLMFLLIFIVTPTTVVGNSMNNTLANNDKLLIWHLAYTPSRDDIVVAHVGEKYNGTNDMLVVKRVIALPGDKLDLKNGNELYVNDVLITDINMNQSVFNILIGIEGNIETSFVVPNAKYLLLGDNRENSYDSRRMGLIDGDDIVGRAFLRILPFSKIGPIKDNKIN
ncbi:MAG: signal peptidase I [Anaeroplasmataceae bacterium]